MELVCALVRLLFILMMYGSMKVCRSKGVGTDMAVIKTEDFSTLVSHQEEALTSYHNIERREAVSTETEPFGARERMRRSMSIQDRFACHCRRYFCWKQCETISWWNLRSRKRRRICNHCHSKGMCISGGIFVFQDACRL